MTAKVPVVEGKMNGQASKWVLAAIAALTGLVLWYLLNSTTLHIHVIEGQPIGGWPNSWLESLLLLPAFVAGSVSMMVPCVLQMSLVYTAVTAGVSAASLENRIPDKPYYRALSQTGLFILGYIALYTALGFVLGAFAQGVATQGNNLLIALRAIGGLFLATLGLHLVGLLNLGLFKICRGPVGFFLGIDPKGHFGSIRAGAAFALYCLGCCGPYIIAVLTVAMATGSVLLSASFLFVFSLGMAAPFLLIAVSHSLASRYLEASQRRMGAISRVSGTLLIVFGVMTALTTYSIHV